MTKNQMMEEMIKEYGFENPYTVRFCKEIEIHPEWSEVYAFNVFEGYCEYAEAEMEG